MKWLLLVVWSLLTILLFFIALVKDSTFYWYTLCVSGFSLSLYGKLLSRSEDVKRKDAES